MKTIWTLTVNTSLPFTCYSEEDMMMTQESFETFDEAKSRLREILKGYAFGENEMFDGNGYLKNFNLYIADREEFERDEGMENIEEDESTWLSSYVMNKIHDSLRDVFEGKDTKISLLHNQYSDMFICIDFSDTSIKFNGWQDGPINRVDPRIDTNMLNMSTEKDYYLSIDDFFGGLWEQEASSELYITLKKSLTS